MVDSLQPGILPKLLHPAFHTKPSADSDSGLNDRTTLLLTDAGLFD